MQQSLTVFMTEKELCKYFVRKERGVCEKNHKLNIYSGCATLLKNLKLEALHWNAAVERVTVGFKSLLCHVSPALNLPQE